MQTLLFRAVAAAAISLFVLVVPGHAAEPLTIEFSERGVSASAVTPHGQVVLFGVAREPSATRPAYPRSVRRVAVLTDDDGDGTVHHDLGQDVPLLGMWVVVDLTTGGFAAAPSPGYEPARIVITPDVARHDNNGQLKKLEWPFAEMEMLLVRPGTGAWRLYAAKHSALDENAASDEPLRVDIDAFEPIGATASSPKNFRKGDVVALIDPRWMQFGVIEVGQ